MAMMEKAEGVGRDSEGKVGGDGEGEASEDGLGGREDSQGAANTVIHTTLKCTTVGRIDISYVSQLVR